MILQIVGFKIQENNLDATHDTIFKILWLHNSDNQAPWHIGEDITLQEYVDHMKHFNAGADQSIVQGEHYQQTVTRAYKQNLTQMIDQSVTIDCNIILVEGFKDEHFDKVVVYQTTEKLERLKQLTDVKYCYDVHDKHALSHYDNWLLQWIEQRIDI